jgi:hypothetical protein
MSEVRKELITSFTITRNVGKLTASFSKAVNHLNTTNTGNKKSQKTLSFMATVSAKI